MDTPVITFTGWSGAGKTTFIEKLLPVLKSKGLRVAVLKSDCHGFQMDREGKDTFRFSAAGAECVGIANAHRAAFLENRRISFAELRAHVENVDLIIGEGWYDEKLPSIEVLRGRYDIRCTDTEMLRAVISDRPCDLRLPQFGLEDTEAVADFIISLIGAGEPCWYPYVRLRTAARLETSVSLKVDGKEIPLLPFVQNILRQVNLALVDTLRDTGAAQTSSIVIEIRPESVEAEP